MSRFDALGEPKEVSLEQGTIRYRERGSGPTLVFVHGALVNGDLWRKVVPELAESYRCITADWPLGSHEKPLKRNADLSPHGVAGLIAGFIDALKLKDVTLVGNDTGGALCQLVVAEHPQSIGRLFLTNCDSDDNFPPPAVRPLLRAARIPGSIFLLAQLARFGVARDLVFRIAAKRPIEAAAVESYVQPMLRNAGTRRDLTKLLIAASPKHTLPDKFPEFKRPVLIAWTPEDRFFPWTYAERLRDAFPEARLERIEDSYVFVPEDQPQRLAGLIADFVQQSSRSAA